jgi:hypothetical protein
MENVCLDKVTLFCIMIVIVGLVTYQYFMHQAELERLLKSNNCPVCPACPVSVQQTETKPREERKPQNIFVDVNQSESVLPSMVDPVREYDYRSLNDPLVPPFKRDDFNIGVLPSIATRGYPTAYKKMGLLIDPDAPNNDPYKFLVLVGRQKHTGSNVYDYYVTENKPDSALKFDLPNLHKELNTDETLEIKELNKTYNIKIDRSLGFEYSPFIY